MRGEMIEFTDGSSTYEAYFVPSATGKGPGLILLQEWWGLVDHIKDVANRFADAGFTVLVPDLYQGKTTTDPDEAATMMQALHIGQTEAILRKAIIILLTRAETQGERVGCVGFCMGGQLALFAAGSNPVIGAVVDFYGIHPAVEPVLRDINGPVLGIFAEHDTDVTAASRAMDSELTILGKSHEFIVYPGVQHAFFNDTRPSVYNAEAAEDAWARTIAFLNDNLR